jgi:hypothetical protein
MPRYLYLCCYPRAKWSREAASSWYFESVAFQGMPLKVHSDPCFHHNVPAGATLLSTLVRGVLLARPNGMVDGLLNGLAIAKAVDRL